MNEEIKARWTTRLRSGQDEQGKNYLRDKDDKFCCLGVLCEIAVEDGVIAPPVFIEGYAYRYGGPGGSNQYLPKSVQEWADLPSEDGKLPNRHDSLVGLNDVGKPFVEIADIIDNEF